MAFLGKFFGRYLLRIMSKRRILSAVAMTLAGTCLLFITTIHYENTLSDLESSNASQGPDLEASKSSQGPDLEASKSSQGPDLEASNAIQEHVADLKASNAIQEQVADLKASNASQGQVAQNQITTYETKLPPLVLKPRRRYSFRVVRYDTDDTDETTDFPVPASRAVNREEHAPTKNAVQNKDTISFPTEMSHTSNVQVNKRKDSIIQKILNSGILPENEKDQNRWNSEGDVSIIPKAEELATMDIKHLSSIYHKYINNIQTMCHNVVRLGKLADGGWDVCDDKKFRPGSNCLVYSFGTKFDFTFDDHVEQKYGCEVHAFDPSMKMDAHTRGKNIHFHPEGLSGKSGTIQKINVPWVMRTFGSHREILGHSKRPIDVLKVDIEAWEWSFLINALMSGTLKDVRQLVIEFHLHLGGLTRPMRNQYIQGLNILRQLYYEGFRIFWTRRNLKCNFYPVEIENPNLSKDFRHQKAGCHEVSFVNIYI